MVMERIPVIASADDLEGAIAYGEANPDARWYVSRRAMILGRDDLVPTTWVDAMTAAFTDPKQREKLADDGEALPDGSFPIPNVDYLKRAVHAYGRAKNKPVAKRHIIKRAKALGAEDALPDGWGSKSQAMAASGAPSETVIPEVEATDIYEPLVASVVSYAAAVTEFDQLKEEMVAIAASAGSVAEFEEAASLVISNSYAEDRLDDLEYGDLNELVQDIVEDLPAMVAGVRHVATPEGADFYGQPVGAEIHKDLPKASLHGLKRLEPGVWSWEKEDPALYDDYSVANIAQLLEMDSDHPMSQGEKAWYKEAVKRSSGAPDLYDWAGEVMAADDAKNVEGSMNVSERGDYKSLSDDERKAYLDARRTPSTSHATGMEAIGKTATSQHDPEAAKPQSKPYKYDSTLDPTSSDFNVDQFGLNKMSENDLRKLAVDVLVTRANQLAARAENPSVTMGESYEAMGEWHKIARRLQDEYGVTIYQHGLESSAWMNPEGGLTAAGERHVRTPEGEKFYGQPIGSVIVPNVYLPLGHKAFGELKAGDFFDSNFRGPNEKYRADSVGPKGSAPGMTEVKAIDANGEHVNIDHPSNHEVAVFKTAPKGAKATLDLGSDKNESIQSQRGRDSTKAKPETNGPRGALLFPQSGKPGADSTTHSQQQSRPGKKAESKIGGTTGNTPRGDTNGAGEGIVKTPAPKIPADRKKGPTPDHIKKLAADNEAKMKAKDAVPKFDWTTHSSGDMEIEMPDNGPTAQVTQDELGGHGKWSATVFPSGEAMEPSSQRQDFDSADAARMWAESEITHGPDELSMPAKNNKPAADYSKPAPDLPESERQLENVRQTIEDLHLSLAGDDGVDGGQDVSDTLQEVVQHLDDGEYDIAQSKMKDLALHYGRDSSVGDGIENAKRELDDYVHGPSGPVAKDRLSNEFHDLADHLEIAGHNSEAADARTIAQRIEDGDAEQALALDTAELHSAVTGTPGMDDKITSALNGLNTYVHGATAAKESFDPSTADPKSMTDGQLTGALDASTQQLHKLKPGSTEFNNAFHRQLSITSEFEARQEPDPVLADKIRKTGVERFDFSREMDAAGGPDKMDWQNMPEDKLNKIIDLPTTSDNLLKAHDAAVAQKAVRDHLKSNPPATPAAPARKTPNLQQERSIFDETVRDMGAGEYTPKDLLQTRNIGLSEIQQAEAESGGERAFVTAKVPSGSEVDISTDLARQELGLPKRPDDVAPKAAAPSSGASGSKPGWKYDPNADDPFAGASDSEVHDFFLSHKTDLSSDEPTSHEADMALSELDRRGLKTWNDKLVKKNDLTKEEVQKAQRPKAKPGRLAVDKNGDLVNADKEVVGSITKNHGPGYRLEVHGEAVKPPRGKAYWTKGEAHAHATKLAEKLKGERAAANSQPDLPETDWRKLMDNMTPRPSRNAISTAERNALLRSTSNGQLQRVYDEVLDRYLNASPDDSLNRRETLVRRVETEARRRGLKLTRSPNVGYRGQN